MEKAKQAVSGFLHKDGKHDTTVHEVHIPIQPFFRVRILIDSRASIPQLPTRKSTAPNMMRRKRSSTVKYTKTITTLQFSPSPTGKFFQKSTSTVLQELSIDRSPTVILHMPLPS